MGRPPYTPSLSCCCQLSLVLDPVLTGCVLSPRCPTVSTHPHSNTCLPAPPDLLLPCSRALHGSHLLCLCRPSQPLGLSALTHPPGPLYALPPPSALARCCALLVILCPSLGASNPLCQPPNPAISLPGVLGLRTARGKGRDHISLFCSPSLPPAEAPSASPAPTQGPAAPSPP